MSQLAEYPTIRVAVNEHLRRVAQQSTYRFDFSRVVDNSMKIIDEPVAFEYAGADGSAFRLAPAGFVALGQSGGWVYDITVALPDGSKPLADVYPIAVAVDSVLGHTQWRRTGGPMPTLEQVRRDVASPEWNSGGDHDLGQWRFGTAELTVTLKRSAERGARTLLPGRRQADDLYIVGLEIYDGSPRRAYNTRLFAIRRAQQGGDAVHPLPLTSVLNDSTPVPDALPSPRTPH